MLNCLSVRDAALPPDVRRGFAARCAAWALPPDVRRGLCRPMCGVVLPPDVRRGLCRPMCDVVLPPDVRRGFAARSAAWLCRPMCDAALPPDLRRGSAAPWPGMKIDGLGPWFGLAPTLSGPRPYQGRSPTLYPNPRQGIALPHIRRRSRNETYLSAKGEAADQRSPLRTNSGR